MSEPYSSYSQLVLNTTQEIDYIVDVQQPSQEMALVAIHGGAIEPLTGEIVRAVAGERYSHYVFDGRRDYEIEALRIPLLRYDEMRLKALLQRSLAAVVIDGSPEQESVVHLGGGNRPLLAHVRAALEDLGWAPERLTLPGASYTPGRLYNWPKHGGVLIELSRGLRQSLLKGPLDERFRDATARNERFQALEDALQGAIAAYIAEALGDLDSTLEEFERATDSIPRSIRSSRHHDHA